MNYDNLTVESIAQSCAEKSGFKINKADLESQIQHLINIEQAKQLILSGVGCSKLNEWIKIAKVNKKILLIGNGSKYNYLQLSCVWHRFNVLYTLLPIVRIKYK